MSVSLGDMMFLGGVGADIFGETHRAQIYKEDKVNHMLL